MSREQLEKVAQEHQIKNIKKFTDENLSYAILDAQAAAASLQPIEKPKAKRGRPRKNPLPEQSGVQDTKSADTGKMRKRLNRSRSRRSRLTRRKIQNKRRNLSPLKERRLSRLLKKEGVSLNPLWFRLRLRPLRRWRRISRNPWRLPPPKSLNSPMLRLQPTNR